MPTLTWVSDIAAVLHCGFTPVFVDIDPRTLGMDNEQVLGKLTPAHPGRLPHARPGLQRPEPAVCSTSWHGAAFR